MKETNTNEQLFDGLFREELGNASSPVPPGVWEGIASSVSGTSAITTAASAGKIAVWMKAAVSVVIASAITVGVYQLQNDKKSVQDTGGKNTGVQEVITEDSKTADAETLTSEPLQVSADKKAEATTKELNKTVGKGLVNKPVQFNNPYSGDGLQFRTFSEPQTNSHPEIKSEEPLNIYGNNPEVSGNAEQSEPADEVEQDNSAAPVKPLNTPGNDSSEIFVPNTVTPNGDGKNDTYLIRLVNEERVEIIIYDPLTNEVLFRTKNKYHGWNCNLPNGEPAPAGNYIVKVIYKFRAKPEAEPIYSKLTLLR